MSDLFNTDYIGHFQFDRTLEGHHLAYLRLFETIRHMRWNEADIQHLPDPIREAVGLPIGHQGMYFLGVADERLQHYDNNLPKPIEYNYPAKGVPGLWCYWRATIDGQAIVWDGGMKFYYPLPWLNFWLEHFVVPWGYRLNGEVKITTQDIELRLQQYDKLCLCNLYEYITITDNQVSTRDEVEVLEVGVYDEWKDDEA